MRSLSSDEDQGELIVNRCEWKGGAWQYKAIATFVVVG
jgi:hypothetical protein